jgi:hypothetical protein
MPLHGLVGPAASLQIGRLDLLQRFDGCPEAAAGDHHILDDARDVEETDTTGKESGDGDFIGSVQDHRREPSQGQSLSGET